MSPEPSLELNKNERFRENLVGTGIYRVDENEGGLTIGFVNGAIMNVWNFYSVFGINLGEELSEDEVSEVQEGPDAFVVRTTKGGTINIGMRDEDYTGPEAFYLQIKNRPGFVWN